ncbi:MAG: hypothetical protein IPG21_06380 [Saprospiraceae bacterium]|nr:hypothetical protein [Candidatus Vicinibacter affinis]
MPSLFLGFCLMSFKIVPSGLTEPLFANFLTFAILAYLSGWSIIATIFISFMPFIRSEGLIILILALSYLLNQKWVLFNNWGRPWIIRDEIFLVTSYGFTVPQLMGFL